MSSPLLIFPKRVFRNILRFSLCALVTSNLYAQWTTDFARISGKVVYGSGAPVANATVEIFTFNPKSGILPSATTQTDQAGAYSFKYPPWGEGYVAAYKFSEGYPNLEWAIYEREKDQSIHEVNLRPNGDLHVDFRLGSPHAVATLRVADAVTGGPVKGVHVSFGLLGKPDLTTELLVPSDGQVHFVLPNHAVTVEVTAPNYITWRYRNPQTGAATLTMKPGVQEHIDVSLTPRKSPVPTTK